MRLRKTMTVALLASTMSLFTATAAHADSGVDGSSSSATATPATTTTGTTSVKPADTSSTVKPADTSTTVKPADTSSTSTPTTTSSTPTTTTSAPCTGSSSSSSGEPVCQEGPTPTTPTPDTPKVPETPDNRVPDVPGETPRGGGDLPFTGPGDVLLAVLLAMLAATGGFALLAGATGREQLETLNRRTMASPSGFKLQYREVLKQLVD